MSDNEEDMNGEVTDSSDGEDEVVEELEIEKEESKKRPSDLPDNPKHLSKKLKHNELYKPPTVDELNNLKEAEALFHSSLFRLQIDELMSEVKVKSLPELRNWVESIKCFLKNIPPSENEYNLDDKSWIKNGVKIPIMHHCENKKSRFLFVPPSEVFETGSYAIEALHSTEAVIDIAVVMPSACWHKEDHLNEVYHLKRALYLVYIAQCLYDEDFVDSLEYCYQHECPLKPALLIKSKLINGTHFTVRLLPCPEALKRGKARFSPDLNNIRFSAFYGPEEKKPDGEEMPSPYYNSTILVDLMMSELTTLIKDKITSQSVKDALILAKIWSRQRGLLKGPMSFNGFIITIIVVYLLMKKKISPLMSSYQIFRNFLLFLKNDELKSGVNMCTEKVDNQPEFSAFQKAFDIVLLDPSGFMNICYNVSKESIQMCGHEADLSLKILDSAPSDSFFLLFIDRIPFCRKFEYLIHLSHVKKFSEYGSTLGLKHKILNHAGDLVTSVTPKLCDILVKALGNRLLLIHYDITPLTSWPVTKKFPRPDARHVTIGLLVNQEFAFNNVVKGPPFDDPMARDFRDFWGKKSELRRFQDGSMHEAVVWSAKTVNAQRRIIHRIAKCVLKKHAGVSLDDIICRGTDVNFALSLPKDPSYGTGEQVFVNLVHSFNSLTKELRKLEGLPLVISSIQGLAAAFRFSEVFPPISKPHFLRKAICSFQGDVMTIKSKSERCPSWVSCLPVVIHFEGSGKWPDEIQAIRRVKAAMHLKLAELLKSQLGIICKPTPSYVDVLKDGYVFRLEVACHKEITLLKQVVTPEGMVKIKENKVARDLEYKTEILPKLNSIFHGLHQQHNSFGTACRLAKRFISSQLLHGYLDDVLIDLLMAFIYVSPEPYTCPSLPQVAFQRFLSLICSHNWSVSPLVVNLNNELKQEELEEIQSTFSSQRANLPPMVVIHPMDKNGTFLTKDSPSQMILKRLVVVTRAALNFLEKKLCEPSESDFEELFIPPLHPYDALIHLKPLQIPKRIYSMRKKVNNCEDKKGKDMPDKHYSQKMPIVSYDPVEYYLKELRETFGDLAFFFYDTYGGRYIAVLWNQSAFKTRPFKVSHVSCHKLDGSSSNGTFNIIPNVEAIITDFAEMGAGLVKSIEKRTEKWDFS